MRLRVRLERIIDNCVQNEDHQRRATCDGGLVRTAGDGDVAVLDVDEVVAGSRRRVRELVAVVHLRADNSHLGRTVHHHRQRSAARPGRHHDELAQLT